MKLTFLFFIILTASYSYGQYSIKGTISDKNDSIIDYNILLLNTSDSTLIRGYQFSSKYFNIDQIRQQNVILKVTSLAYNDTLIHIGFQTNEFDLGTIRLLKMNQMDSVVVFAKKSLFEKNDGNTIVNVENTMLGSATSVIELLTKTPSVRVEDNLVTIFGKGEALIYLNDKQITFERLGSIPVNRVIKIEIISNPSAKYDAKGRAVINIITKANTAEGFNGQIVETVTQAKHLLNSTAVNLNYKKNKLSLFTDYSVSLGKDWNKNYTDIKITNSDQVYNSHNDSEENTRLTNISNYRIGLNYDINNHSDFSIQYDGLYNRYDMNLSSLTKMVGSTGSTTLDVFNNGRTINQSNSVNLNYNNTLDTLGSNLFIGCQYSNFANVLYDQIDEKISQNDIFAIRAARTNDGLNVVKLFTGQIDYTKIFKDQSKLELGAKYSNVKNNGRIDFKSKNEGTEEWENYPQFSNNFLYTENVPALYVQYSKSLNDKWKATIGTRLEFSNIYGFSRALNKKVIDTNYVNIFPTGKITYNKSDKLSFTLSFSSRINRPLYQNIDPFVWYNDSLNSIQGNPHLIPEKNYSTEFQTIYKDYSLKLGYTYAIDPIKGLPISGNNGPNSIIFSRFNLKSLQQYYCSFEIPIEKKYFSSYNTIKGTYEKVSAFTSDISTQSSTPQLYLYSYNQIKIIKFCRIDLSAEFTSAYSDGLYKYKSNYLLALGLSKNFFNKNLLTRITANDFLSSYYKQRVSQIGIFESKSYAKYNTVFVRFSITYKFGKLKSPTYKNKTINDDELNRAQ